MNLHRSLAWFAGLLFACTTAGWANNVTVTANANLTFTPATVTINVGDSVTFKNVGNVPHNVVANDGSFTSGAVATGWTFTQTFSTPGTIGYYCTLHGAPGEGMFGSVIVNAVTPPPPTITIGGYMSGNWYNPQQAGQGFQIEAATNNNMVAIW
ncbi:MAG: plastocyanin/azurin family copper-binding protein, partial [Rudaea sp.]|nr:plastocyanin/azurin family copper-binding protein [Rudaea sp.]